MPVKQNVYKSLIRCTGHRRSLETPGNGYQGNTEIDLMEMDTRAIEK
jgi:hypothetical protein